MERVKKTLPRVPGWIASVLMIFFTAIWTFWGAAEMYHEGWWGAWYNRLLYLIPIAVTLIPTLAAFRWPIVGGILIMLVGIFAIFTFRYTVAFIGTVIALMGIAFLLEGIYRRRHAEERTDAILPWWRRNLRYLFAVGLPLLIFLGVSAYMLPIVLTREDDGDRSARLVVGNGVTLVWAPEGPGWNWQQPWGGYPSWQSIALYGISPVGLDDKPGFGKIGPGDDDIVFATETDMSRSNICRYLSADGTTLLDEPQDLWRMPTTDELVRSLSRHGENAGCVWQGEFRERVACIVLPDKESPLWSTDRAPIYYWTSDSYSEDMGYFVAYNGTVNATYKLGGNPRHGYRCVRDP